jgi:N-methylhydantoinase A
VHFNLTAAGAARHVMPAAPDPQPREAQTRMVSFRGHGFIATRVVARSSLRSGEVIDGPAIVNEHTSTTLIPPGYTAEVSSGATMILRRER